MARSHCERREGPGFGSGTHERPKRHDCGLVGGKSQVKLANEEMCHQLGAENCAPVKTRGSYRAVPPGDALLANGVLVRPDANPGCLRTTPR